jgi:hypothetical protein
MASALMRIFGLWLPIAAAIAILVSTSVSEAKEPPPEMRTFCFEEKNFDCSGPICSCCTEDGCWICDRHEEYNDATCHWDDKYGSRVQRQEVLPGGLPLAVSPGSSTPGSRLPPTLRPGGINQRLKQQ